MKLTHPNTPKPGQANMSEHRGSNHQKENPNIKQKGSRDVHKKASENKTRMGQSHAQLPTQIFSVSPTRDNLRTKPTVNKARQSV